MEAEPLANIVSDPIRAAEAIAKANAGVPLTEYEISHMLGVSRARIWQLHERAIRKLRLAMRAFENYSESN